MSLVLPARLDEMVVEDKEHLGPEHLARGVPHHMLLGVGSDKCPRKARHPIIHILLLRTVHIQGALL